MFWVSKKLQPTFVFSQLLVQLSNDYQSKTMQSTAAAMQFNKCQKEIK